MFVLGTEQERHLFDPRSKLLLIFTVSVLTVLTNNVLHLIGLLGVVVVSALILPVDRSLLWRTTRPVAKASIPILILQTLFHEPKGIGLIIIPLNSPILPGMILIGWDALSTALLFVFRLLIISIVALLFSATTNPRDFLQSLMQLRVPFSLAFATGLTIFFLPLIRQETDEVTMALKTSGITIDEGPISQRLRALKLIFTGIFLNFIEKTRYQAIALDTRGFRLYRTRTSIRPVYFTWRDVILFILVICFFVILLIIQFIRIEGLEVILRGIEVLT